MLQNQSKKIAIIIGAGPAGLTAALELLKQKDVLPLVIEEKNIVGGISATIDFNGNKMDIGGHRFFSKSETVNKLWFSFLPLQGHPSIDDKFLNKEKKYSKLPSAPDPEKEDKTILIRDRYSRIYYLKKFFSYPISLKLETFLNLGIVRSLKIIFSYFYARIYRILPEKSLEDFMINRFGKELYLTFFKDYTKKVWGIDSEYLPADWGVQRIKGISLSKVVFKAILSLWPFTKGTSKNKKIEASLIEEFFYPKYGPGQLWQEMKNKIENSGGIVKLNSRLRKIDVLNNVVLGVEIENNGKIDYIKCDYLLSSMPIKDLVNSFSQVVPEKIKNIANGLLYRDFISLGVLVKKLKIKNSTQIKTINNIIPDTWIYIQEREVKIGRLQVFNNWSPYLVKDFLNTVWLGLEYFVQEGDELWSLSEEDFKNFAINELEKIGILEKEDVLNAHQAKIKKAYPSYFGSYAEFPLLKEYINKISNLYLIGRNGQHRYNNMDHSMLSALEAVSNIKNNIISKDNIWAVNSEEDYHETKK
ncbi:MAG: NAD(P)/FAD-dependent oxidoreductase [Planctomycetes bacterium]|jgi:protoporphyrinogen oxidase|nr:NAD(P)/FAD-dependent oxidoreductase [Planctomycetota bacterium]